MGSPHKVNISPKKMYNIEVLTLKNNHWESSNVTPLFASWKVSLSKSSATKVQHNNGDYTYLAKIAAVITGIMIKR